MSQMRLRQIKQLDQDPMLVSGKAETQTQVSLPLNIFGLNHNSILPLTSLTQQCVGSLVWGIGIEREHSRHQREGRGKKSRMVTINPILPVCTCYSLYQQQLSNFPSLESGLVSVTFCFNLQKYGIAEARSQKHFL